MKTSLCVARAAAALAAGCAEKTRYGDPRGVETVSNQFGSTDLQMMAESMARSMLQAPVIASANLPIVTVQSLDEAIKFVNARPKPLAAYLFTKTKAVRERVIREVPAGGMVINHVFPADGEYQFEMTFNSGENTRFEDIDISIDGERVALVEYELINIAGADGRGQTPLRTEPILVKAGQHKVAAAFIKKIDGPYEDLIRPHDWSYAGGGSGGAGITTLPHMGDLIIRGPMKTTGISTTPSRQKIFSCRPTSPSNERACARQIIAKVGGDAYRRPLPPAEVDRLMPFYDAGAAKGGFEMGVRSSLEAILASPHFIYRAESGEGAGVGRLSDLELASRLSFFLWSSIPDDELLNLAAQKRLSQPAVLTQQVRRMLQDPKAEALVDTSRASG